MVTYGAKSFLPLNIFSMNPNHYCDIERCKKLTEITEKSKTFGTQLQWYQMVWKPETLRLVQHLAPIDVQEEFVAWCPSVMEMLDVIPDVIENREEYGDKESYFNFDKKSGWYEFWYLDCYVPQISFQDTLPNALADLIFWLVENSYLTIWKSE